MADQAKIGTIWQENELDAIVSDYFAMLSSDLHHRPYVKAKHEADLMAKIGRTHKAIEFKHQNISAVLDELGLPWIQATFRSEITKRQSSRQSIGT
ncbi:MAG: hypothetical protein ABIR70_06545 [Bryobacteraceae bacterium]